MTKELKCPRCGSTKIKEYDCYDRYFGAGKTVKELYCGNCENCKIDLTWTKVYKIESFGYDEVEENE